MYWPLLNRYSENFGFGPGSFSLLGGPLIKARSDYVCMHVDIHTHLAREGERASEPATILRLVKLRKRSSMRYVQDSYMKTLVSIRTSNVHLNLASCPWQLECGPSAALPVVLRATGAGGRVAVVFFKGLLECRSVYSIMMPNYLR